MIEKDAGQWTLTCDFCAGEYIETGEYDFYEAVIAAQRKGWKVFKSKGEWQHKCPGCAMPEGMEEFGE